MLEEDQADGADRARGEQQQPVEQPAGSGPPAEDAGSEGEGFADADPFAEEA